METFSIKNNRPGEPAAIFKGIAVREGSRIQIGGTDDSTFGAASVPLSAELQAALGGSGVLKNASVMKSPADFTFLAVENIEGDKKGAVLVHINVTPSDGDSIDITEAKIKSYRCILQGHPSFFGGTCDLCNVEYTRDDTADTFTHPTFGQWVSYGEYFHTQVKEIGEGTRIVDGKGSHKELLLIMKPGARIRIALVRDGKAVSEQVLVRTHTELDFAAPGYTYLASELDESSAAYV